jgi:hypothetical protein
MRHANDPTLLALLREDGVRHVVDEFRQHRDDCLKLISSSWIAVGLSAVVVLCGCDGAPITGLWDVPSGTQGSIVSGRPPLSVAGDWRVHDPNTWYDSGLTKIYTFDESGALLSRKQLEQDRTYTEDFSNGTLTDAYAGGGTYTSPNVLTYATTTWVGQRVTIEIFNKLDNAVHERYRLDLTADATTMSGTLEVPVIGAETFDFILVRL